MDDNALRRLSTVYRVIEDRYSPLLLAQALKTAPDGPVVPCPTNRGTLEIREQMEREEVNSALRQILNQPSINRGQFHAGVDGDRATCQHHLVMSMGKLLLGESWEPELNT